jgi:hypothetical protein
MWIFERSKKFRRPTNTTEFLKRKNNQTHNKLEVFPNFIHAFLLKFLIFIEIIIILCIAQVHVSHSKCRYIMHNMIDKVTHSFGTELFH